MCDSVSSTALLLPYSGFGLPKSRFSRSSRVVVPRIVRNLQTCALYLDCSSSRNGGTFFISACFMSNEAEKPSAKSANSLKTKTSRNSIPTGSGEYDFYGELGIKQKEKEKIDFEPGKEESKRGKENGINSGNGTEVDDATASSAVNFIGFDDESDAKFVGRSKDEDLVRTEEGNNGFGSKLPELQARNGVRRGRQVMKRSNIIAKQVISIQSALSLGFVSQLWVDIASWMVLVVEVRPSLLSGEVERFFLEDVSQVGDVVLIQDESVMDNELKMVGLETLVGYNVVTPGQRSIGKVRGYTFNINTGAVESLELDSFGISIIPSGLVSTYSLLVEDVLEVLSDTVVVHEAAASHTQRLTKGFWDSKKLGNSIEELQDYSDVESEPVRFDHGPSRRRGFNGQKFRKKMRESADDWGLPMDYL